MTLMDAAGGDLGTSLVHGQRLDNLKCLSLAFLKMEADTRQLPTMQDRLADGK